MDLTIEEQASIWGFYQPRQTHSWNMLVLSHREIDTFEDFDSHTFELEYHWENFILRLWLFRNCIRTLEKIEFVQQEAVDIIKKFDCVFIQNEQNHLKAIRDMIEHWDDDAAGSGYGPAKRTENLEPWREIDKSKFERGWLNIELESAYSAAIELRENARCLSKNSPTTTKATARRGAPNPLARYHRNHSAFSPLADSKP